MPRRQLPGKQGHPRIHAPYRSTRPNLPGDVTEQVRPDRQMSIREVDGIGRSVGVGIGECLEINRVDAEPCQPTDQMIDIAALLLGIRIVDVVEIDVGDLLWPIVFGETAIADVDRIAQIADVHLRLDQNATQA